jgi:hypothetical protein
MSFLDAATSVSPSQESRVRRRKLQDLCGFPCLFSSVRELVSTIDGSYKLDLAGGGFYTLASVQGLVDLGQQRVQSEWFVE